MKLSLKPSLRYRMARVWLLGHRTLSGLKKSPPLGSFRVLLFHDIAPEQMEDFERLVDYLLKNHGVLTPQQASSRLSDQPGHTDNRRVPYLLTFDDGFHSHARIASEVLDPRGVKGVFFVCPGLIDSDEPEHRETISRFIFEGAVQSNDLPQEMALMSWSETEQLHANGHTIGAHGFTHRRLAGLRRSELEREVIGSGNRLQERLGVAPEWFAYPFGDLSSIDQQSLDAIAGRYRYCCSGIRGINWPGLPPMALLREQLDLEGPFAYQQLVMEGGLDFYYGSKQDGLQELAGKRT